MRNHVNGHSVIGKETNQREECTIKEVVAKHGHAAHVGLEDMDDDGDGEALEEIRDHPLLISAASVEVQHIVYS